MWRTKAKPRRRPSPPPRSPEVVGDVDELFRSWFEARGISRLLGPSVPGVYDWVCRRFLTPAVNAQEHWVTAYHGTWVYSVWQIAVAGKLWASFDKAAGHEFSVAGVYVAPDLGTAAWYARPQVVFGDGVFYRALVEVRVDPVHKVHRLKRKRTENSGGDQWIFRDDQVALHALWIKANSPPLVGEERLYEWSPADEVVPDGRMAVAAMVNPTMTALVTPTAG